MGTVRRDESACEGRAGDAVARDSGSARGSLKTWGRDAAIALHDVAPESAFLRLENHQLTASSVSDDDGGLARST